MPNADDLPFGERPSVGGRSAKSLRSSLPTLFFVGIGNSSRRSGLTNGAPQVPAPERGKRTTWSQFLKSHWDVLAAADFFTVEVWCPRGLVTFYVFFAIELATRRVRIVGITPGPNEAWMMQAGRNLTDAVDGFLAGKQFLILDRDTKYSAAFRDLLKDAGVEMSSVCLRVRPI